MGFEEVTGYAALVGLAMILVGTIVLALFPDWGGFTYQGAEQAQPAPLDRLVKAIVDAFTAFLGIVVKMVSGKAGDYHPGQIFIAVGFLLFLVCSLLWVIAQIV
jgi:hypothetical protein